MAKQGGPGKRGKGRSGSGKGTKTTGARRTSSDTKSRSNRIGRRERKDRAETWDGGSSATRDRSAATSAKRQPPLTAPTARRDRDGLVRTSHAPDAFGQRLEVEDREGVFWTVECLGEPVEVGARIAFEPLSSEGSRASSGTSRRAPERSRRVEKGPRHGELIRVISMPRDRWVCRVSRPVSRGLLGLTLFGGEGGPAFSLHERDAQGAEEGDRVIVVAHGPQPRSRGKSERAERAAMDPARRGPRSVRVSSVLGPAGLPDADHQALVWKHRLPESFSRRARIEAETIDSKLTAGVLKDRIDLRSLPFITIDPATAKDHDDAVFAEESAPDSVHSVGGAKRRPAWSRRLWVGIADVSHFVEEGGFIDAEARRRGNSFYFPDRSIPMLPERLSSDLCSLRPDVDRLAIVVELRIGGDGVVLDALFHEAVIRSHARLAYEDAAAWLVGDESSGEGEPVWGPSLRCLDRIAGDFGRARSAAGALTLELPETEVVIGPDGRVSDMRLRSRNRAHILIEEAMLAANRAVARAMDVAERNTIHRVHPPPPPSKLDALALLLERFGVEVSGDLAESGVLARALESVRGLPSEERLNMAALRSMSQARYEAVSGGHHALRFDHYLHFTSPIRRYADLEVHRGLRRLIRGVSLGSEETTQHAERCDRVARWLSGRERVATEVERDAEALASCALLADRVGERFMAEVTGATEFGLFIRLESPSVSGLVPMRTLDGRWEVEEDGEALVGERSGARIAVGDRIKVRLLGTDFDRARLSFNLDRKPSAGRKQGAAT